MEDDKSKIIRQNLLDPTVREAEVIAKMEAGELLNYQEFGNQMGISRQAVEQFVISLVGKGLWKWPFHTIECRHCGIKHEFYNKTKRIRKAAYLMGWRNSCRDGEFAWRCGDCLSRNKKTRTPSAGSIPGKLLKWMEAGNEYRAVHAAKDIGVHPAAISSAKGRLIKGGFWIWETTPTWWRRGGGPGLPAIVTYKKELEKELADINEYLATKYTAREVG